MAPSFPTSTFKAQFHTYSYIHIPNKNNTNYILILHGWPSIPTDFSHQIAHLTSLNYGIIAPYLLGYHPSSTPKTLSSYTLKCMANDIAGLVDSITPKLFAVIGHDWGSTLLSRLEYYHPEVVSRLIYLTVGPVPFGQEFDLDAVNRFTKEMLGYEALGYQKFLVAEGAAERLREQHERFEMLMFAKESNEPWKRFVGSLGGVEEWLSGEMQVEMIDVKEEDLSRRKAVFVGKVGQVAGEFGAGYAGSLMWYHAHVGNVNVEDEQERDGWKEYRTGKKMLMVTCGKDPVAIPAMHVDFAKGSVKNEEQLTVKELDAGHFVMYEQAEQLNQVIEEWLACE